MPAPSHVARRVGHSAVPELPRYISYSLFTTKLGAAGRAWDAYESDRDRYWFNVPALAIVNALLYPGYVMRVHVDRATHDHALFPMLVKLHERRLVEVVTRDYPFKNTEPTLWRIEPVWRESYDIVLCRDIDSVPNTREARATIAFANSDFLIHTMRTHPAHNGSDTRLLAGLCGFRRGIQAYLTGTFDDYYRMADEHWGTDQQILIRYFVERLGDHFVKAKLLDTCVHAFAGMSEVIPGHDAGKIPQAAYDGVDLSHVPETVRRLLDSLTLWPGQPVNARGAATLALFDVDAEPARAVADCVAANSTAMKFYRGPERRTAFDDKLVLLRSSSVSDTPHFRHVCAVAVANDAVFSEFRRQPAYMILEHVGEAQGREYLEEVRRQSPELLDISLVRANDACGGPPLADYAGLGAVAPSTLRYLKVLSDLVRLFGPLDELHVVEVGGGYGGQARLIRSRYPAVRYTLIDLPEPLALARKYLERSRVDAAVAYVACSTSAEVPTIAGDVFLSNYALSECAPDWVDAYVRRVAMHCARGYITGNAQEAALFHKLALVAPQRLDERPLTAPGNYICAWGAR